MRRTIPGAVLGLALCLATLSLAAATASDITLRLRSGQTWRGQLNSAVEVTFVEGGREQKVEGTIVRADTTMVVVETSAAGKTARKPILFADVRGIKNLAGSPSDAAAAPAGTTGAVPATGSGGEPAKAPRKGPADFNGVYVLPLKGMVGVGMRHDEMKRIGEEADKAGPGQIIVLLIESGGGLVLEGDRIHETLKDLKKRHRLVAWIKEAISAAAFTAMHCDEIYFMRVGALGSITMFAGQTAISGAELDAWLEKITEVAKLGGHDPIVARCMVTKPLECSYDIPEGGTRKEAIFYPDLRGRYKLDDKDNMLTLNAQQAYDCGFADGIADTEEELAALLGLPEWKEASDVGRRMADSWQKTLERGNQEIPKLVARFDFKGQGSGDPATAIGNQISLAQELLRWYDRVGDQVMAIEYGKYGVPPRQALERGIAQLRKELADVQRNRRGGGG